MYNGVVTIPNVILFTCLLLLTNKVSSKVDPPNYDFSVDKFEVFMPGQSKAEIEKIYKDGELTFNSSGFQTYKYFVEHIRYKFPIFVQYFDNKVTDFHARLPAYFLHDIFHQSLINRLGPQDKYRKVEEQAVYIWKNKKNFRHVYSGGCSITCFPIYYSVRFEDSSKQANYLPLLEKFKNQN